MWCDLQLLTILSMQGTLAKHAKLTLPLNYTKEPFHPSPSTDGIGDSANRLNKQFENENRQCKITGIVHAGLAAPIFNSLVYKVLWLVKRMW